VADRPDSRITRRFGVSELHQLHQLRGRVGRGTAPRLPRSSRPTRTWPATRPSAKQSKNSWASEPNTSARPDAIAAVNPKKGLIGFTGLTSFKGANGL